MSPSKFIFLDFDGVLNSESNYRKLQMAGMPTRDEFGTLFDERCVTALRDIIDATHAELVISSSWRYLLDLTELRIMWQTRGLPGHIHSITPTDFFPDPFDKLLRGKEVEAWFKSNHEDEDSCPYVIIDDENEFMTKQLAHFVWTNPERGLAKLDVDRAISILNQEGASNDSFTQCDWKEDLIWCPSQLYAHVIDPRGQKYVLYLRWSWNDPWEFCIYKENEEANMVSIEIPFYKDEQYKEAEFFAERWFASHNQKLDELF